MTTDPEQPVWLGMRRENAIIYIRGDGDIDEYHMYMAAAIHNACYLCSQPVAEEHVRGSGTLYTCYGGCGQRYWEDDG